MKRGEVSQWGSSPTYISLRSLPELPRSSRTPSQAEGKAWAASRMGVVVGRKVENKQRYHFQLLKQYFLFPEASQSSLSVSVNNYDPLLFPDQQLHSLLRILETQRTQRKIWAFISLKLHHRSQQLHTLLAPLAHAQKRIHFEHKHHSFAAIREAATQTNEHRATQTCLPSHSSTAIQAKAVKTLGRSSQVNLAVAGERREERKTAFREERKSVKWEGSISRRTAEEEQEDNYYRRNREQSYTCNLCCFACCCCRSPVNNSLAQLDADLWQRIQYLRRLEEMAAQCPP